MKNDNATGSTGARWRLDLAGKPDFDASLARIYAWFEQAIVDRPPVRFSRHNAYYDEADAAAQSRYPTLRDWWFDAEYQVERFVQQIAGKRYHGETFPIFWPNLGPNVFAGCYGAPQAFGAVTSWAEPILTNYGQPLVLDWHCEYLRQLEEQTRLALARCDGQFMVGYTDLHPGIDWLAALRGSQQNHPAGFRHADDGRLVMLVVQLFNGECFRLIAGTDILDAVINFNQALFKRRVLIGTHCAVSDGRKTVACIFHNAPAHDRIAGVDAQNPHSIPFPCV